MRGVAYAHWQCVHMRPKKEECVCGVCVCVYVCVHVANVFECVRCMFEFIGVLRSSYCSRPPMSCQILFTFVHVVSRNINLGCLRMTVTAPRVT